MALALALTHYRGSLFDLPGTRSTASSCPDWLKNLHFNHNLAVDCKTDMTGLMQRPDRDRVVLLPTLAMGPDLVLLMTDSKTASTPAVVASGVVVGTRASGAPALIPIYIQSKLRQHQKKH